MPTSHRWGMTIPFLPPSKTTLAQFLPSARAEVCLTWFNYLRKTLGHTPKATGRRRLTITFLHHEASSFDPDAAAVDACLVQPLCPQPEVAGRFSRGRKTGTSFFSRKPGLGLILGDQGSGWLELKVSHRKVEDLFEEGTEILLEDITAGDLPQDRQAELCAYTEELQRALWVFAHPFNGPDADIAEGMAREAAKALLERPAPRLLDLHRRGQLIHDTTEEAS